MPIVVGVKGSPDGISALNRATEEALRRGEMLHLVGFVQMPIYEPSAARGQELLAERRTALEKIAQQVVSVPHEVHVPFGVHEPSEAILRVAETVRANLIVIGVRRRTIVGKFLLGSTVVDVLQNAHCDVLAVHTSTE